MVDTIGFEPTTSFVSICMFGPVEESRQLADFNSLAFHRVEPPEDA
jgi:hypothetical protein